MSYIRFDQWSGFGSASIPLMTADGRTLVPPSTSVPTVSGAAANAAVSVPVSASNAAANATVSTMPSSYQQAVRPVQQYQPPTQLPQYQQLPIQPQAPSLSLPPQVLNIRGIYPLMARIGFPDIYDPKRGGIAIWSRETLQKRSYGFLKRVEIIDEYIPSSVPVEHHSNIYIWVLMSLSRDMMSNILALSKDFYYDQKKELMIIRSDTLDTAVAQAALLIMYSTGKTSYYKILADNLLLTYYNGVKRPRTLKTMYTILSQGGI